MRRLNIVLVRYLFIFLLFAAFMLLLFVPVYRYVMDFTLQNEMAYISGKMEQGIATVDSMVTALNSVVLSTRRDSRFIGFKSLSPPAGAVSWLKAVDPTTLAELRDALNMALLPHSLPLDAGFLFPGGEAVSRQSVYYYPASLPFYGRFFRSGDLSPEAWNAVLKGDRPFLPARTYTSVYYGDYEAVVYTGHWAYAGFPEEILFFAALPVEGMISLIVDADVAAAGYIRMYDGGGNLLFARGNGAGGGFHRVSRQSPANLIRYEAGLPSSFIAEKTRPVRNRILLFMGITAAFVILLAFLFAWRSSVPERIFLELAGFAGTGPGGFNVFFGFKRMFLELAENISLIETRLESSLHTIETQTALIRAQTIDRIRGALLSGDEAAARTILKDCAAALPRPEDPLIAGLLAGMLSAMLRKLGAEQSGVIPPVDPPEYAPGSQEEIFEKLYPACFSRICESVRSRRAKDIPALGREVLAYINEHLYSPGLYITMAADHFAISSPDPSKTDQTEYRPNLSKLCGKMPPGPGFRPAFWRPEKHRGNRRGLRFFQRRYFFAQL